MSLILAVGCRGKGGDADPGWDDPDNYWEDPNVYEEDEGYNGPNDSAGSGEFYDVYARGMELMGMFKELKFSTRSDYGDQGNYRADASFSFIGEEVVDGQKTKHFACTYNDGGDEGKLEVWVDENCEPVQALVDGVLATGPEVGPATLQFDYVLTQFGEEFFNVLNEEELKEAITERWNADKVSREVRDFGFGAIEVTRYELSQLIDPEQFDYSRTDYLVWEYAKVGSKFLCTKWVDTNDKNESLRELTVERVIPY